MLKPASYIGTHLYNAILTLHYRESGTYFLNFLILSIESRHNSTWVANWFSGVGTLLGDEKKRKKFQLFVRFIFYTETTDWRLIDVHSVH